MAKIPYSELKSLLMDPAVPDSQIATFLRVNPDASGPFDPNVVPDSRKVDLGPEGEFDTENAMRWANGINRWRRQQRFDSRIRSGSTLPVLVSEGDSWFQFPFLIRDVVDQLEDDYLIWSLDAAGDTTENMVRKRPEYMQALSMQKENKVRAFLFSGAGNDIIGEDILGNPVLANLVRPHQPGGSVASHINRDNLSAIMTFIERAYRQVVGTIRADADFAKLPILIHGYDYALPGGSPDDPRNPVWAHQDKWLGSALSANAIEDHTLRTSIIRYLIDELYRVLRDVAGDSSKTRVYLVDVRNTLPVVNDWADEIHATDDGFRRVAERFVSCLEEAGVR